MISDGPVISLKSVMLRYENGVKALKNVDLNLYVPSFQYITGPSGSGKTSILNLISTSCSPTYGDLKIYGKDIKDISSDELCKVKQEIGFISQHKQLVDSMTVLENIALPLKIRGVDSKTRESKVMEILDWFEMGEYKNYYPFYLSQGQKQCVSICRALIGNPKILLADDPVCYLDNRMANKVIGLFYEMSKSGACVLITNNNEQKAPPMLKQAKEIKIMGGMLLDNILSPRKTDDLSLAI